MARCVFSERRKCLYLWMKSDMKECLIDFPKIQESETKEEEKWKFVRL